MTAVLLLSLLSACGGLPPEAEEAIVAANDMLATTLVVAEGGQNVREREGSLGKAASPDCPTITREGGLTDFTVEADYGQGCVPDSGLVPVPVSGAVSLSYASQVLSLAFAEWAVDGQGVDGTVSGSYESLVGGLTLSLDSDLAFSGEGLPSSVVEAITAALGVTEVELDGEGAVTYPDGAAYGALATDVILPYANIQSCPVPDSGKVVVDQDGLVTTLTFIGDGQVTVEHGKLSVDVPLCDYPGGLY